MIFGKQRLRKSDSPDFFRVFFREQKLRDQSLLYDRELGRSKLWRAQLLGEECEHFFNILAHAPYRKIHPELTGRKLNGRAKMFKFIINGVFIFFYGTLVKHRHHQVSKCGVFFWAIHAPS